MENKLHIFGCSHSTCHKVHEKESWYHKLSEKLKIPYYPRVGQSGHGVCNINFDMLSRISTDSIKKDDYVILNTSYSTRWSSINFPHIDNDKTLFYKTIEKDSAKYELETVHLDGSGFTFKEDDIISINFLQWITITISMFDILKKYCDNVYIWFLEDTDEFEVILSHLKEMKMIKDFRIGINPIDISEIEFSSKIFEGHIIEKPDEYDCWNSFIQDNSFVDDMHMSKVAHHEFAKYLYNFIKNKKKK
tara:strand:- start:138 stop:881 length:744 start_codon:yes stop_codon:yes gene_type:complete